MNTRKSRGMRQITEGLGALDAELFGAIADSPSPLLDKTMPALTRAADHAKLWLAIAAALAMSGNRSARRGAGRRVATATAPLRVRSARPAPAARPDLAFDALRPLRQRRSVCCRCGTGKPHAGAAPCTPGRPRRVLAHRDRRALPRRRAGRLRYRRVDRGVGWAPGSADR